MPGTGSEGIASVIETLAGLTTAARDGNLDDMTALSALAAARRLAAELERSELALIEAARAGGATWSRIAAAIGAASRQTAQKRHADLARRCRRPPSVDTPAGPPTSQPQEAGHECSIPEATAPVSDGALPKSTRRPPPRAREASHLTPGVPAHAGQPAAPAQHATPRRRSDLPRITHAIIVESRYELVKAPDHAETRAWHVLAGGRLTGLVRPTWRGERSRPGWEPVDLSGLALPATGIGRTTPAGNARTRDAAAVSMLRALQRQQEQERMKATR